METNNEAYLNQDEIIKWLRFIGDDFDSGDEGFDTRPECAVNEDKDHCCPAHLNCGICRFKYMRQKGWLSGYRERKENGKRMAGKIPVEELDEGTRQKLGLSNRPLKPKLIITGRVLQCLEGLNRRDALWVLRTTRNLVKGYSATHKEL